MKNRYDHIIRIAMVLSMFLPGAKVMCQSNHLDIEIIEAMAGNFNLDDGSNSVSTSLKISNPPTGHPHILTFSALVYIPNGTEITISVSPGSPELVYEDRVPPVPPRMSESFTGTMPHESTYINQSIYNTNSNYPGIFARIQPLGKIRGQDVGILYIYPFQYNPVIKKTYVYKDLHISLGYDLDNIESMPANLITEYDPVITQVINYDPSVTPVINYDQVIHLELNEKRTIKDKSFVTGYDFIIITNATLKPAADRLKIFRESQGLKTYVKTISTGAEPNVIESYIDDCYDNMLPVPKYILLLGDVGIIPHSEEIENKTSDLPYYDREDTIPRLPDISGGRIPVSSLAQANNWINKIIRYEKIQQNDSFFSQSALISFFEPTGTGTGTEMRRYIRTCEELRMQFEFRNIDYNRLYYSEEDYIQTYTNNNAYIIDGDDLSTPLPVSIRLPNSYGFLWNKEASDIIQSINQNKYLVIHRGHGSETSWGTREYVQFSSGDVSSLTNLNYPSVIWSLNCLTGNFDWGTDCISEKLGKHTNGGAVAIIAATDETETFYNDHFAHGLAEAVWPEFQDLRHGVPASSGVYNKLRMGDILRYGLFHLVNVQEDPEHIDQGAANHINCYHLLGDPTMEILPYSTCVDEKTVGSATVSSDQIRLYDHVKALTVQGNFIVLSGGVTDMRAGNSIILKEGFKVNSNGHFLACLEDCYEPYDKSLPSTRTIEYFNSRFKPNNVDIIASYTDDTNLSGIIVYPNPTQGLLNIESNSYDKPAILKIYNQVGIQLHQQTINNSKDVIDISGFDDGLYILEFNINQQTKHQLKIIKL